MGDNYYNNQYGPPPGSGGGGGGQYYPPPPRQEYSPAPAGYREEHRHGSQSRATPPPQGSYGTYQPPREEQYRSSPVPPNMQMSTYHDDYDYDGRRPSGSYVPPSSAYGGQHGEQHHHHRPSDAGYAHEGRPGSRGSHKHGGEKKGHEAERSVGATLLGGAVGALAGREISDKHHGISTVIGALAGAYGGHELEQKYEKNKKHKKERRESEAMAGGAGYGSREVYGGHDDVRRRSRSRSRQRSVGGGEKKNRSRSISSGSSSSDGGGDRRRRGSSNRHY